MEKTRLRWLWTLVLVLLFCGTGREVYGQTKTYLTGQKTGNKIAPALISLGTGSAGVSPPMLEHNYSSGGLFPTTNFFYKGVASILNNNTAFTTLRASQDLGVLGLLGAGGDVYIQFRKSDLSTSFSAKTPVYFRIDEPTSSGINLALGGLLGLVKLESIFGRGFQNAGNYNENGAGSENAGTAAGTTQNTKTRFLIDADGRWYIVVIPDAPFNSVRLGVKMADDLRIAGVARAVELKVYNAFTQSSGGSCSKDAQYTSQGEASGIVLNGGALGLNLSQLISNPQFAINNNENEYASYSSGAVDLGVASKISQTVYFDHVASSSDGFRVKLGLSNSLIGLGVGKLNAVKFIVYNGESEAPVWSGGLEAIAQLLGLDLLNLINIGSSHKEVDIVFKPKVEFDRIKIEYDAGLLNLGVIGDALRLYNISLAPSAPEVLGSAGQPDDVEVCEGESAVFNVEATVPNGVLTYLWEYWNGTGWVAAGGTNNLAEYTITNAQISDNNKKYRVKIVGGITGCEQIIYSDDAVLRVKPTPGKPHLTISDIIN